MRDNALKSLFKSGGAALNGWLHIPSSVSAEVMAHQGFDSLTLDLQHGLIHYESAVPMLQAISTTATVPLCRVPWNEPGIIMKLLDAGAYGIICPMVNSRAEAEAFVGACRYPPQGNRSYGPTRARYYAGEDYPERANDTVLTFAMIETKEALDNLEDILSVPGLDGIYVGPADLSQSLDGPPGADFETGPVAEALPVILGAAKRHALIAGIHNASAAYAKRMVEQGFGFVTVQSDLNFLATAAKAVVRAVKETDSEVTDSGAKKPDPY